MPRDPRHDYRTRCIYHITMTKAAGVPVFSKLVGPPEAVEVERLPVGRIIERHLRTTRALCPHLRVLQYVIMPDHIHFAIFAEDYLPRALGSYIGMLKVKIGQQVRQEFPACGPVFTDDFYDRILRPYQSLTTICEYIRQNPYRLAVRRANPDYFHKVANISIGNSRWQAYGNLQLLENPFKAPVVIHRADSPGLRQAKQNRWFHIASNGGVLVSPFISPAEKEIRRQAEALGSKIILLTNEPFTERWKPAAHDFDRCVSGRLLILAPEEFIPPGRDTFLYLNSIAETLCGLKPPQKTAGASHDDPAASKP